MKIIFNKEQLKKAIEIAVARHEAKDKSFRTKDIYFNKEKNSLGIANEYMPHLIGVVGEMAWAILNNLNLDEGIYKVRDCGEDFDGVEIKTTTYFGYGEPELKIKQQEFYKKTPNTYVLVRVNPKNLDTEILGKITRKNFENLKVVKKYGENLPVNFVVPLSKMEKINQ